MMLFKLEGSLERYDCPESWQDIPVSKFLHYAQHIAPTFPNALQEMADLNATIARLEPDVKRYEKKHGVSGEKLMEMIDAGSVPKKTAAYFPEVYREYDTAKKAGARLEKTMGIGWYAKTYLPYMAATVSHFTGVPIEACNGIGGRYMLVGTLEYLFEVIMNVLRTEPKDRHKQVFDIAGERYTLPEGLMKRSTLIEFAEAAQFEEAMQSVKNGEYAALLDIAAVILRPEGVPYSEEQYERGRKVLEAHMNMDDLYQVGFFLGRQSEKYANAILNYMLVGATQAIND
jgi:hypothetical protein